jgi:hypothetical protein
LTAQLISEDNNRSRQNAHALSLVYARFFSINNAENRFWCSGFDKIIPNALIKADTRSQAFHSAGLFCPANNSLLCLSVFTLKEKSLKMLRELTKESKVSKYAVA